MSAIAVLGIAALCAGAIYCEHWLVRREARRRSRLRRRRWLEVLGLEADPTAPDLWRAGDDTRPLVTALERAVFAAEVAWSYRARFEGVSQRSESPFELRRGRMQAELDRFCNALGDAEASARDWLAVPGRVLDPRRRQALDRLLSLSSSGDEHPRRELVVGAWSSHGRGASLSQLEVAIDVLEYAIVSLSPCRDSMRGVDHPFRNG